MWRFVRRIVALGVDASTSDFDAQRVRMLNIGLLMALALSWLTMPLAIATGGAESLAGSFVLLAVAAIGFGLQHKGRNYLAALSVTLLCFFMLLSNWVFLGPEFGVHFWLVGLILFPVLFFPRRSRYSPIVLGTLIAIVFTGIGIVDQRTVDYPFGHLVTQILAAWLVLGLSLTMRLLLLRVEERSEEQRQRLSAAFRELEEAGEAVSLALEREREVSRLKEELLASMSHELRTPLNAVMGLSEALREEVYGPLTDKQVESLRTIWSSGAKLQAMFDDLLDFARIGAGRYPTELEAVNLSTSVSTAADRISRAVTNAGLRLVVEVDDGQLFAMVDARHLRRILANLLDNAIKFTPEGGEIGIELHDHEGSETLEVVIRDTGIGITAEKIPTLFDPFVQVDGGLSRRFGGTGLGLALTHRLMRLLGAELSVESVVGEGSRFTLRFDRVIPDARGRFSGSDPRP